MRSGKLRHRLDFEAPGLQQDPATGEMLEGWTLVWSKVPASIEALSARDLIAAKAGQSEVSARIVIRYRTGILPTMRILHRDVIYNIQGLPLPDKVSGLEYLTLLVAAGVNDG
ncbi:phage head closure protein [Pseudomonas sp. RTC3]|uniref:phage head closure protein n=1 Tax=unclassified Pseudomonas TaxID=196821 RepID=UPI002AB4497F|nr:MULTISPECIES: phage head closure protein [unclassified Pseudomonas]MEB0062457.1 phage head closure protein [Pseudomonas sp. RTC3]MDY7565788.1 phage head closure protein [Pseudomonas sp. 5C2]MEB0027595.1 phage head closure protein [Pseudomonas sp. MH9.2]MEB0240462.1 phage head closure protein [Pseudomonas sp. 5C2]WPX70347.1 phage head closure protein [Pseudomonas sp. MH9.2]